MLLLRKIQSFRTLPACERRCYLSALLLLVDIGLRVFPWQQCHRWLLNLLGEPVLHASAVAVRDEAVAFLGASGMGKPTLATLLCSTGAHLVTDDVLRLQRRDDGFACHFGTGELRLCPNAAPLAGLFPPDKTKLSADGRTTVRFNPAPSTLPRLRAIFLPRPAREQRVERLSHLQASFHLNGYPRVLGWRVDEPRQPASCAVGITVRLRPACRHSRRCKSCLA